MHYDLKENYSWDIARIFFFLELTKKSLSEEIHIFDRRIFSGLSKRFSGLNRKYSLQSLKTVFFSEKKNMWEELSAL